MLPVSPWYRPRAVPGKKPWPIAQDEYVQVHGRLPESDSGCHRAATIRRKQWWTDAVLKARRGLR